MRASASRVIVTGVMFGLLVVLAAAPAGAVQASAPIANPDPVAPGQSFTVSGNADCITGSTITVAIPALQLSTTTNADAAWQVSFTAPSTAATGSYPITVSNSECGYSQGALTIATAVATTTTTAVVTTTTTAVTTTTVKPTTTTVKATTTTTAAAAAAVAVQSAPAFTG